MAIDWTMSAEHRRAAIQSFRMGGMSVCDCGHRGDGARSEHDGLNGHGKCMIEGCRCQQFSWHYYMAFPEG